MSLSEWSVVRGKNWPILTWKCKQTKETPTFWHNLPCKGDDVVELTAIAARLNATSGYVRFDVGQGGSWHITIDDELVGWYGYDYRKRCDVFESHL